MNQLEAIYSATKQLKSIFDHSITSENREAVLEQINHLIEERDSYLKKIHPPYTNEEKVIGKKIVTLNKHIQKQINLLFDELKIEMKEINDRRKSNHSYTNPFKDVHTVDGMFMDSKK